MTLTRRLGFAAIVLATLLLAVANFFWGRSTGLALTILNGTVWLLAAQRGWKLTAQITFGMTVALTVLAGVGSTPPLLPLAAILSALAAWDLTRLHTRLQEMKPPETALRLERLHLKRLGYTLAIGGVAGAAAVLVRFQLPFGAAIGLSALAFIILSLAIRGLFQIGSPSSGG